jgi:hypothetical protein
LFQSTQDNLKKALVRSIGFLHDFRLYKMLERFGVEVVK